MLILVRINIKAYEDVLSGECHEEIIVAMDLVVLLIIMAMTSFVYLHSKNSVANQLAQINTSSRVTTAGLQIIVQRLVVKEAIKVLGNKGDNGILPCFGPDERSPGVSWKMMGKTVRAETVVLWVGTAWAWEVMRFAIRAAKVKVLRRALEATLKNALVITNTISITGNATVLVLSVRLAYL